MAPKPYWEDSNLDCLTKPGANPADQNPESREAGLRAYSTSKLALVYLFPEVARRHPRVKFLVYSPGFVPGTGLSRDAASILRFWFSNGENGL
ncbi:unnamed protein product [Kuraishia capsulata CBS 1993]|uniref:Uncharacterized protein n=1 Tax=Kuraishia capsulata CBS 1993 TaxID=1382522 RepID=W6MRL7_9ASCO|nr:uncharacterized protein KUCA_T00000438001 [Kuraishia capsulata CBS 1993]CDK24475.1 unnamed protein product [Kuraishia capsulata CBS 1993]